MKMRENETVEDAKPFSSHQYEWINGHLVNKDDYSDDEKEREKRFREVEEKADKNMNMLNTALAVVNKIVIPVSLTITGAIIAMIFQMIQK